MMYKALSEMAHGFLSSLVIGKAMIFLGGMQAGYAFSRDDIEAAVVGTAVAAGGYLLDKLRENYRINRLQTNNQNHNHDLEQIIH